MSDGTDEDKSFRERVEEIRRKRKEEREQDQSSTPIDEISLEKWVKEVRHKEEPDRQDSSSTSDDEKSFRERVEEIRRKRKESQEWDSSNLLEQNQLSSTDENISVESLLNQVEEISERVDNEDDLNSASNSSSSSISNQETSSGESIEETSKPSETAGHLQDRDTFLATKQSTSSIPNIIPDLNDLNVSYDDFMEKDNIGQGGNADVTKAAVSTEDSTVPLAIKKPRLSGTISRSDMDEIIQEAEIWDKLDDHDHIVGIAGYDRKPVPWIAMEYMNGGHLGDRSGTIDIPQALWTAIAVTKGVRYAHQRGVVHLDLKPENVLFRTVDGAWDVPKVADWGLSKRLLDHSQSIEGFSPGYAAPEQFDGTYGSVDHLTDIYQLGAVFYNLFTGKSPFGGKPAKAMHKVLNEDPTPPTKIAEVPDKLDEIIGKALAKEKDDRYEDIVYLRDDLLEISENLNSHV